VTSNQAGPVAVALGASIDAVRGLTFNQLIASSLCAGVSLDTLGQAFAGRL
jgi:hypothetical protein